MKPLLTLGIVALAGIVSLAAGSAKADMIDSFDAVGTFASGSTLSGTVTIDVTNGVVQSLNLVVSAPALLTFSFIQGQFPFAGLYEIQSGPTAAGLPNFNFAAAGASNLIGYAGGNFSTASDIFYSAISQDRLVSGTLFLVPEPATFSMLGVGVLGLALTRKRRREPTSD